MKFFYFTDGDDCSNLVFKFIVGLEVDGNLLGLDIWIEIESHVI